MSKTLQQIILISSASGNSRLVDNAEKFIFLIYLADNVIDERDQDWLRTSFVKIVTRN